jgi:hypothetical protein
VFTERLLEGGVTVDLGDGEELVVTLDLDMGRVHHLRAVETELTPVGQKRHHAVEADHQMQGGTRITVENERNLTVTGNAMWHVGKMPLKEFETFVGGSLTGTSTKQNAEAVANVSATKRAPRFEGESAYFDFRGASLRTAIRQRDQADRTGGLELTARMAFPEEVAPLKQPGDPAGAFREQPRTLPGSRRYGVDQAVGADVQAGREAPEKRFEPVINHVLSTPEWAGGGLVELRQPVLDILGRDGQVDKGVIEGVESFLSETSFMRFYTDILGGSGATSPMIRDSKGKNVGQLVVSARLRTVQASTKSKLGVKEEAQRFLQVEHSKSEGGSMTATVTASAAYDIGDPEGLLGTFSNVGGGINIAATLSQERSHIADTGSGDIRGLVIWGNSILYLSDFEFTVQVVTPNARFGEFPFLVGPEARATGTVNVGVRIPELHQARFEALLEQAESGTPGPLSAGIDGRQPGHRLCRGQLPARRRGRAG